VLIYQRGRSPVCADGWPDGQLELPINVMVVDKEGRTLHAVIEASGMKFH
jgi:hypothetical protein